MGDAQGGNGIDWSVVCENRAGRSVLAHGAIGTGGSQAIPAPAEARKLSEVAVESGDTVSLVVGAKDGNHICDTTIVELVITEVGGSGRTWNLTQEVVDSIHAGNPHADAAGNADVWHFYSRASGGRSAGSFSSRRFVQASQATTAREFLQELAAKNLTTIRQRTRAHDEQTWAGAVAAMRGTDLPPHPRPPFEPAMQVEVPCERLTAQWKLGAWHILRHSVKDAAGQVALQRLSVRHPRLRDLHDPARPGPAGHAPGGRRRPGPVAEPAAAAAGRPPGPTAARSRTGRWGTSPTAAAASPTPWVRTARAGTWTPSTPWGRAPSCSRWPSISG